MDWKEQLQYAQPLVQHLCMHCNAEIPSDRVEFLQSSGRPCVCINCTAESPKLTLMEYGHKTAGYLVVVGKGDEHKALRAYRRAR